MAQGDSNRAQLAQHSLRISDPDSSIPFYLDKLGMALMARRVHGSATHYFLGFAESGSEAPALEADIAQWQSKCFLELIHDRTRLPADVRKQPDTSEGYWKIAISVTDVDVARNRLIASGVDVDKPRQIPDMAYLCHFNDPDSYCIELIQHDFLHNHVAEAENSAYGLGTPPTFSLITYRVKDATKSLNFYERVLGMRLLSKQAVEARGFTLYFLAYTDEEPPHPDIESVDNREWLWQRPYTMLELQHIWGTESQTDFAYRVGPETGFVGVSLDIKGLADFLGKIASHGCAFEICDVDPVLNVTTATVSDPDGYSIRLIDKA